MLMQPPATTWSVTQPQSEVMGPANEQQGLVTYSLARTVHDTREQRAVADSHTYFSGALRNVKVYNMTFGEMITTTMF